MSLIIYDIVFLVAFAIFVSVFLYTRKHNLKKEGLLFLYKAQWGIKLIDYIGNKSPRTFKILSWISVSIGYLLMATAFYLVWGILRIYLFNPEAVRQIKVPPITPIVPYIDKLIPNLGLPPFYFIYFIVIIAIIAITHEFAHGIFAAYNKVRIKSTGFGFFPFFLPVFLAAFVELDEKKMAKKSIFGQLAILSAGTFANVLTAIFFFVILLGYFSIAFTPSGVIYDVYPYSIVEASGITMINGIALNNPSYSEILDLTNEEKFNKIKVNGIDYLATTNILEDQKDNEGIIRLYYDAPAINIDLESVILKIDGKQIGSVSELESRLSEYSSGDEIILTVLDDDNEEFDRKITLGDHPEKDKAWLGIGFSEPRSRTGVLGKVFVALSSFKDKNIYYKESVKEFSLFFYDFLWWIVLISLSVALVNMLPVGIFDGGRFFYLTVLAITGKEKIARKAFSFSTYFFLFVVLVLMFYWAKSLFF